MSCLPLALEIQQIPAPTFQERARAEFVLKTFVSCGLESAFIHEHDGGIVNVYARIPGIAQDRPVVLVSAHLDTVFSADTNLEANQSASGRVSGPGIGDNSVAVAALLVVARRLAAKDAPPPCDIWFVANSAEEGLGNLQGIKAAIELLSVRIKSTGEGQITPFGAAVVVEGMALGDIYHTGIAVRRYRLRVETAGGHSWGDFGRPSAIHVLMQLGARVAEIEVPLEPRTTFNIGLVSGGTSVNTIAGTAAVEIDLRSESPDALQALEARVFGIIDSFRDNRVEIQVEPIGNRPAGAISRDHPLVRAAIVAVESIGRRPRFPTGSTDANALLAAGIPSVCVGITSGGNPHRTDEWIESRPIEEGVDQLEELLLGAAELIANGAIP